MTIFYADAEEKYVQKVVLHGHSDTYLYYDEDHTESIAHDDLLNLCMKGLAIIEYGDSYYTPVYFKDNTTDVSVTIATTIDTSSSASVTLKSKEPAVG